MPLGGAGSTRAAVEDCGDLVDDLVSSHAERLVSPIFGGTYQ